MVVYTKYNFQSDLRLYFFEWNRCSKSHHFGSCNAEVPPTCASCISFSHLPNMFLNAIGHGVFQIRAVLHFWLTVFFSTALLVLVVFLFDQLQQIVGVVSQLFFQPDAMQDCFQTNHRLHGQMRPLVCFLCVCQCFILILQCTLVVVKVKIIQWIYMHFKRNKSIGDKM